MNFYFRRKPAGLTVRATEVWDELVIVLMESRPVLGMSWRNEVLPRTSRRVNWKMGICRRTPEEIKTRNKEHKGCFVDTIA